jgi:hypothetical protein
MSVREDILKAHQSGVSRNGWRARSGGSRLGNPTAGDVLIVRGD